MNSFNAVMEPPMILGTIKYTSLEAFHSGVAALVREGVTFEAIEQNLTITLTGGY
jgi:hypothetical protein